MRIWAYCLIWNEEKMLDYYLRHYSQFCDKIIFYDNESTDRSREIIESYANTEIRTYKTDGKLSDQAYKDLKTSSIQDARGNADYVIISDCDEFIYHPNIRKFLSDTLQKYSVYYPAGFQMASQSFPTTKGQIYHEVDRGEPSPWYAKPMLINPNLVGDLSYVDGCHEFETLDGLIKAPIYHPVPEQIRPEGEYKGHRWGKWQMMYDILHMFNDQPLKMLHYKFLGAEFVNDRYRQYMNRYSDYNLENQVSMHYKDAIESNSVQRDIDEVLIKSVKVSL